MWGFTPIERGRGMGLRTWITKILSGGMRQTTEVEASEFWNLAADAYLRVLAFECAKNIIANAVSKCEFKTYFNGKEKKAQEYYLWNVEPNVNQNSTAFIGKLINQLFDNNEALVIENGGHLFVADSFQMKPYALYDYQFSQVTIEDFTFNKTFAMSDVLYFKLRTCDIRPIINCMAESYGKLAAYAMKAYQKSKGSRGILDISTQAQGDKEFNSTFDKLMNDRFKTFFAADSAVLPLFNGYKYTDATARSTTPETTRDIKAMANDIFDFTGRAIGVPTPLMTGEVADTSKAVDQLLTFCIDPLCDMIQEEINRKRSGYAGFSKGTFVKIYTSAIKHIDLLDVATAIDKLIGSGAFCINDIRAAVNEEPIDEPWAWQHFMTKNYSTVQDLLAALVEGGEKP